MACGTDIEASFKMKPKIDKTSDNRNACAHKSNEFFISHR